MTNFLRPYKIQKAKQARGSTHQYTITISPDIAKLLPADMGFYCELTDQGILYRPVLNTASTLTVPSWVSDIKQGS